MGIIKSDEIRGFRFRNGEIVFSQCSEEKELENLKQEEILTDRDFDDDDFCFCDRCKE